MRLLKLVLAVIGIVVVIGVVLNNLFLVALFGMLMLVAHTLGLWRGDHE